MPEKEEKIFLVQKQRFTSFVAIGFILAATKEEAIEKLKKSSTNDNSLIVQEIKEIK